MQTSMEKILKKNSAIRDAKKGLKQDAEVQHGALLYPQFTLMCYTGITSTSE